MINRSDDFFNPERLRKNWEFEEQVEEEQEEIPEALELLDAFQRSVEGHFGVHSKNVVFLIENAKNLIQKQVGNEEEEPLQGEDLKANRASLSILYDQIEDVLDTLQMIPR